MATLFSGRLAVRDGEGSAALTSVEPGAGYVPVRARLTLRLIAGGCTRPASGLLRIEGSGGGPDLVALDFATASCSRARGTYRGPDGPQPGGRGTAILDAGSDGQVLLSLYP